MPLTTTTRGTPAGILLKDGYSAKIGMANNTTISFWEKEITPFSLDGGEKIPQTTMFNAMYRTYASRGLIDLGDCTIKAAYDPNVINLIISQINVEQGVTIRYRDGSTLDVYAFLKSFVPDALVEGKQPEATIVFCATNCDPTTRAEVAPVLTSVAGT